MTIDLHAELHRLNELISRLTRGDLATAGELAERATFVQQVVDSLPKPSPAVPLVAAAAHHESREVASLLLVGFDAAWTATNFGALVGIVRFSDGTYSELGSPVTANYAQAEAIIRSWQTELSPAQTIVLIDQPTIVPNSAGQRPVENIVCSAVSRRYGGMQPSNTAKAEMFGAAAPVWSFLRTFGGAPDPFGRLDQSCVLETYPVLAMIALDWMLPDEKRTTGRLPKYNPSVRGNFSLSDWKHVCESAADVFRKRGLTLAVSWLESAYANTRPRKRDRDCLDAYLCLIVALEVAEKEKCLVVGQFDTGYIVVPHGPALLAELTTRCLAVGRCADDWVRILHIAPEAAVVID